MEADVGEELVALDVGQGTCFGFNEVAKAVWRELETPQGFNALRKELLRTYDVGEDECAQDLRALLDQLVSEGLIEEVDSNPVAK